MSWPPALPSRPDPTASPTLRSRRRLAYLSAFLVACTLLFAHPSAAQENGALPVPADTTALDPSQADTLQPALPPPDTLRADTPQVPPPGAGASESRLKKPVTFSASDSLVITFDEAGGDRGSLFGNAKVTYDQANLDAYRVDILFDLDELRASGLEADTGMIGRPRFAQGSEAFQGTSLAFNLRTERGRVVGAQTAIEDGFIQAGVVKVAEDSTLYIADGAYTTCECEPGETPSYTLRSSKMKVVDGEWIYTGPIRLYLFNIPTPLWLPFGFLPAREGRRSGPLPPQYGQDERGFYLRQWGWYQAISDYMDAQIQFGIWTRGSWEINPLFRYARRYRYSGQLDLDYVRSRSGERDDPDLLVLTTSALRWRHNQTLDPSTSFTANVNLSSQNYLRTISEQYDDRVRSTVQSGINFSKQWRSTGRSVTVNLSQRQVLATGQTDLTLPTLSFSQGSRKPFARRLRRPGQDEQWYEKITYTYSSNLSNQFTYTPRNDSLANLYPWYEVLFNPEAFRTATGTQNTPFNFKTSHRVSSNASFNVERLPLLGPLRLNLSPGVNYTEDWYLQTNRISFERDTTQNRSRAVTRTVSDWLAVRQFSTSLSANTTVYGLFPLRAGPYQGLRHTVRPSLSFTYRPDFYDDFWGYTDVYYDSTQQREVRYALVPGVQSGLQKSVSFSVANVFETKHVRPDTSGGTRGPQSQVVQLLNLDFSSSYNFAADSLKLSPILASARTRLFDRFDLRANASFSPYATVTDSLGTRHVVDRYLLQGPGLRLARLTQFNLNIGTAFQSSRRTGESRPTGIDPRASFQPSSDLFGDTGPDAFGDPLGDPLAPTPYGLSGTYADFAIPWSLRLDFSYSYTESRSIRVPSRPRANVNASFDFNLTPNWKVQGRSGYDFTEREMVMTSLSIYRDLDCWEMSFSWIPFGPYQSYSFDLHVKSGHLRDLLRFRQPRSDVRGRFGGL